MKQPSTKPIESPLRTGKANADEASPDATAPAARKRQRATAPTEAPPLRVLPPAPLKVFVAQTRRRAPANCGRVLVVDGHPMVEEWIGRLIAGEAALVSAGHLTDLRETAALVARGCPSLVLMEIAQDIPRSLEIIRDLKARFPKLHILVFSSCDELVYSVQVLRAGARGFVSKTASGAELLRAVRQVLHDGVYLSSAMIGHLAAGASATPTPSKTGPVALLSQRELEVFAFIGEGLHPKEIGQRISLSVKTVESYQARIRQKLNLKDARALFQEAVKWCRSRDAAAGS